MSGVYVAELWQRLATQRRLLDYLSPTSTMYLALEAMHDDCWTHLRDLVPTLRARDEDPRSVIAAMAF
jgi:hypothetical protein